MSHRTQNMPPADDGDIARLPGLPRDAEGPVFSEPWQAQAFAMTLRLHRGGHFTWKEWTQFLGAEITAARDRGEPDSGENYYLYWLTALEKLVAAKGLLSSDVLNNRRDAWDRAARATPHGEPIVLGREEKH